MNRYEAIKCVSEAILGDGLVEAIFLKGSIARNEDDDYSDVDMYAVVSAENSDVFLEKRIRYMENYMPLIYWSESNFVAPQVVGVYQNALHFDLYTVNTNEIPQTDSIKIIYDKNGVLESYKQKTLNILPSTITQELDEFSFTLLEFEIAYSRKDLIWAIRLFNHELTSVSMFLRFIYDEDYSLMGLKGLHKVIPQDIYKDYLDILEKATPSSILSAMQKLLILADRAIQKLPDSIVSPMNKAFYTFMRKRIFELKQ
jgi:predicted nucleotidyltransferase